MGCTEAVAEVNVLMAAQNMKARANISCVVRVHDVMRHHLVM